MPRRLRISTGGLAYHVLNRAVARDRIFEDAADYARRGLKSPPKWLLPLDRWPAEAPARWTGYVNRPQTEAELAAIRVSVKRGRPYGDERWQVRTAARLGLESTLRPRGRQRIYPIKDSRPP